MKDARVIASILLLSAALGASARDGTDAFVLAQVDEITSLDPAYPYDNASQNLIFNVYDTLIGLAPSSSRRLVPKLAVAVPSVRNGGISADGRVYRFRIRRGVRFQDGSLMTPEDVRYSLLRFMLKDRPGGPSALLLEPILGVSSTRDARGRIAIDFKSAARAVRVDKGDVVVTLRRPFAPFLSVMARWSYVLPRRWAAEHGDWDGTERTWAKFNGPLEDDGYLHDHMDGTGPFRLERWDSAAKYVVLERNDDYWRKPAALRRVVIKTVPEFSTRRLMLEAGDADAVDVPPAFLKELRKTKDVRIAGHLKRLATDPVFFFTFKINAAGNRDVGSGRPDGRGIPPDFFSDLNVREAFAHAFNADAFIQDALVGQAQKARTVVPPELLPKNLKTPWNRYDLDRARAYFKKARGGQVWERGFRFTLSYNIGSESRQEACLMLKKSVESLNPRFHIDIRGLDWPSFLERSEKRLMPMFIRGWYADYPDAYNFLSAFYQSDGRYPLEQGYSDPAMDRLIAEAARRTGNPASVYARILERAYEQAVSIPVAHPFGTYALRKEVARFHDEPAALGFDYYEIGKSDAPR